MIMSAYAELNPQINYNKALPNSNFSPNKFDQFEETPKFSKFQEMYGESGKFGDYYSGGGSSAAIRGLGMENTPVSLLYFSDENMARIQKQIKQEVYRLTKGKFKLQVDQDPADLLIVMRAVFLDDDGAKNLPTQIVRQVKILNKQTLQYLIPDMISNIKQQYNYIKETNEPRKIMQQPLNVNKSQRGTLPSITSLWQ
jgi:hypothetical protein